MTQDVSASLWFLLLFLTGALDGKTASESNFEERRGDSDGEKQNVHISHTHTHTALTYTHCTYSHHTLPPPRTHYTYTTQLPPHNSHTTQ